MKTITKALKRVSDLVSLRKEKYPYYSILEAPFYYYQGHLLISYIEAKSDVFGNIPELAFEESEEEEAEDEEDQEEEEA